MGLFSNSVLAVRNKCSKDANMAGGNPLINVFVIVEATLVACKKSLFPDVPFTTPLLKFIERMDPWFFLKFPLSANTNCLHFVKFWQVLCYNFSEDSSADYRKDSTKNNKNNKFLFVIIFERFFYRL